MMEKTTLADLAKQYNRELSDFIQAIFNELNKGQTKKVLDGHPEREELMNRYHITHK